MASIVLESVSKQFPGGVLAVKQLDLEIRDREFLVLVGPSGCGKSTTLRMIAGLEEVSTGEISIGGHVMNHVAPKDRDIAMVFQNYALYPHMSVYKNMAFGLQLRYGDGLFSRVLSRLVKPAEAKRLTELRQSIRGKVEDAAQMLGIQHLLNRKPRELSGGERQRVALGRALVRDPAAFLFDEPLSNLDARLRVQMRRELKELHQQLQTTMVLVTHDQMEALTLGDRIVVMDAGEVQQVGTPMEIYECPANRFVAGFVGTPPMNFLSGSWQEGDEGIQFQAPGVSLRVGGVDEERLRANDQSELVLGVRPEDVLLGEGEGEFVAQVRAVELLGDATLVYFQIGDVCEEPFVAKLSAGKQWTVGESVPFRLREQRLHWFDASTGSSLRRRVA
jgi:ABC-type sugar transport system ATPase subunit